MDYEIVEIEEKKVVAIPARTNNNSPEMGNVIGGLYGTLYGEHVYEAIPHKINQKRIGLYCEYESDYNGDYTVAVGAEVSEVDTLPEKTKTYLVPKGKYAKFVLKGELHKIVGEFWANLESVGLQRTYQYDFEEYQDFETEDTEVHVYIGIK